MPIYEYSCKDCGSRFEKLVRNHSEEIACPSCGEKHLQQELSVFSAQVKSGGKSANGPMCPSGGMCPTPGACGLN